MFMFMFVYAEGCVCALTGIWMSKTESDNIYYCSDCVCCIVRVIIVVVDWWCLLFGYSCACILFSTLEYLYGFGVINS